MQTQAAGSQVRGAGERGRRRAHRHGARADAPPEARRAVGEGPLLAGYLPGGRREHPPRRCVPAGMPAGPADTQYDARRNIYFKWFHGII